MRYVIAIILLVGALTAKSQVAKIFMDKNKQVVKDSSRAFSYLVRKKAPDIGCYVKEYSLDNLLLSEGLYKDDSLKVPEGKFSYYFIGWRKDTANDHYYSYLKTTGYYSNGLKTGAWITYDQTGYKIEIANYSNDKMNGTVQDFSGPDHILADGNYVDGKREGDWHVYDKNGKVFITDTYSGGEVIKTVRLKSDLAPKGNITPDVSSIKIGQPDYSNRVTGIVVTENSEAAQNAVPEGDFKALLTKKVTRRINKNMNDWLLVRVRIAYTGRVSESYLMKGLGTDFDQFVMDAIERICYWHPAMKHGEPVDQFVFCTIRINNSRVDVNYFYNSDDVNKY